MQGYTWYHLRKQKIDSEQSLSAFNTSSENHAQTQQSKRTVQEKIDFVNQQKKGTITPLLYLKNIYYNPSQPITTMTLKGQQFSLTLHTQTIRIAQEFLKGLKMQPLIRKARFVHMHKDDTHYRVEIKGKFQPQ